MIWLLGAASIKGVHISRHTTRGKIEEIDSMTTDLPHRSRVARMLPWPTEHQEDAGYAAVACLRSRAIDLGKVRKPTSTAVTM